MDLKHCPTEVMWSDVLNKPKQGMSFRKDRAVLMNVPVEYDDDLELSRTHVDLLPSPKQVQSVTEKTSPVTDCRSVLGDIGNRDLRSRDEGVTWADKVRQGPARAGIPT